MRAYKALLPDERAAPYLKPVAILHVVAEAIRGQAWAGGYFCRLGESRGAAGRKVEGVAITAPIIEGDEAGGRVDLSAIDFDKLAKLFADRPRTTAEGTRRVDDAG